MASLTTLDYTVIFIFLALIFFVGVVMSRRAAKSMEHYYLGGRNLPWYMLGVSGMSDWFDLTGTMIITSFLFLLGPSGLFIEFRGGAVLVLAFMLAYTGKWHRRSGCMTAAEWNSYRFGTSFSGEFLRLISAIMTVLTLVGMVAYMVKGSTLFMGLMFDYNPVVVTLGLLAFASSFTILAGFYGVVLSDLVQGSIMIIGCIVVAVLAWNSVPDAQTLATTATEVTGNPAWYSSGLQWKVENMPAVYQSKGYDYLMMFAMLYLLRQCLNGMTTGAEPRFFAARNSRECGLQCMLQGVMVMFRWPMMIGFAIMGIFLVKDLIPDQGVAGSMAAAVREQYRADKAPHLQLDLRSLPSAEPAEKSQREFWNGMRSEWHEYKAMIMRNAENYPELVSQLREGFGDDWKSSLGVLGFDGRADAEMIVPSVLAHKVRVGVKGFLIVGLLAALMSSLTSMINQGSALITRDIYQNFLRKKAGNRELILVAYTSTAAVVFLGIWLGRMAENINDIWSWIVMGLTAGALGPKFLRLYWWRTNAWGMASGFFVGGAAAVIQRSLAPNMAEGFQFLLCGGTSILGVVIVSLLTKPTESETVRHFYRTTKPFGFWKPMRNELSAEEKQSWFKEHFNDIITIPFALLSQVCLFMIPMQILTKNFSALWATGPLFLLGACGLYKFWWKNLPSKDEYVINASPRGESAFHD